MRLIASIFILSFVSFFSLGQANSSFEILGTAKGFPDSTFLLLDYIDGSSKVLDSAVVVGEKFTFKGNLNTNATRALIKTKNLSDYKLFWLENSTIAFNAEKGKFREGAVTGSKLLQEQNELDLLIKGKSDKKRVELEKDYVRRNPNSLISVYLLSVYSSTWGRDTTIVLYEALSDELKETLYGNAISEFIALNKNLAVGDRYVDFSQEDTQGKIVNLSDFEGKIVLLEFWGSWCAPCRKQNPELVKIYQEFNGKGFEVLGVGVETRKEAWLKAIETDKLPWTNVSDLKGDKNAAVLMYGVSYFPANFLIDKTGAIVARDLKGDKLRRKLRELMDAE